MNFIMIGLLLREALDRLCVRLNMYLVLNIFSYFKARIAAASKFHHASLVRLPHSAFHPSVV